MQILSVLFLLIAASPSFAKVSLGLNDVSVLIPLPRLEEDARFLLKPQDGLISAELLAELDPLIMDDNTVDRSKSLKVIAFRIDPCFNESTPMACRKQLRLVFQPMSYYQNGSLVFDAAVHAFYDFDDKTFAALLKDWKTTVTDGSDKQMLQVHPVLKFQGLRGPLWQRYREIILKYCSTKNLTRLTESTVDKFGMNWEFSGFDISAQGISKIQIPRTSTSKQIFFSNPGDLTEFSAEISPVLETDMQWNNFFDGSARQPKATQWEAVRKSFEFENPQKFNTANLDCVSCHMAQSVRLWGESHLNAWATDSVIKKNRFSNPRNLEQSAKPFSITNRVRAFGYFFDEANISPRVINESAQTADALEKLLQ